MLERFVPQLFHKCNCAYFSSCVQRLQRPISSCNRARGRLLSTRLTSSPSPIFRKDLGVGNQSTFPFIASTTSSSSSATASTVVDSVAAPSPSSRATTKWRSPPSLMSVPSSSQRTTVATMSTSSSNLPAFVVMSGYNEIPGGIRSYMKEKYPEAYSQAIFISYDAPFSGEVLDILQKAEVIFMDTHRLPALMMVAENLKWVQSTWAGVDSFIDKVDSSVLPPKFVLTKMAGIFDAHMAEYVIGQIIAFERHFKMTWEAQQQKDWCKDRYDAVGYRILKGRTISVIGAGNIGTRIAKVCKVFNMRVIGLGRKEVPEHQRSEYFDEYRVNKDLPYVLEEADYVVSVLPQTKQTTGFFCGDILSHCKKKPVFINIGRGSAISEESILKAIREGWISHAVLDVLETEPLPKESPLWTMPEVTITPHVSGQSHGPELVEVFMENYRRYIAGEPLKNQLDWEARY